MKRMKASSGTTCKRVRQSIYSIVNSMVNQSRSWLQPLAIFLAAGVMFAQSGRPLNENRAAIPLRFRLDLDAISPAQVTVPEGNYVVQVLNAAVLAPITIQFRDEKASVTAAARVATKDKLLKSKMETQLKAGKYVLSVEGRPSWKSNITVVSK